MTAMTSNCAAGDTEVRPKRPTKERAGGDLFMTLMHTAESCGANSFDYLTELQRHIQELQATPHVWMPWNCRERLARSGLSDPVYIAITPTWSAALFGATQVAWHG